MGGEMFRRLSCRILGVIISLVTLFLAAPTQAAPFDYRPYESILHRFAKTGVAIEGIDVTAVDYTGLAAEAKQSSSNYTTLLSDLRSFNPETLDSREDKIAFWINVYNIAAVKTIVDHYPVDSIRNKKIHWLGLPWDRKIITVGGKEYSLGQIENDILLDTFKDLRIHFGLNCASVSCVNLAPEPYRGGTLMRQLDEQGKHFLSDPQKGLRVDRQKKVVYLSKVFKFDQKHFDQLGGGALNFILPYLSPENREFIRKEKENLTVEYLDYIWKSNDIKNVR